MTWETVTSSGDGATERLFLGAGWIYRTAWRYQLTRGSVPIEGVAVTYVPADGVVDAPAEPVAEPSVEVELTAEAPAELAAA